MTTVLDWLEDPAPDRGIHVAAANDEWRFHSYGRIARDTRRVAALLAERGAAPGGVVCLQIGDPKIFVPAFLGTMLAGLTPSPIASPVAYTALDLYTEHVAGILRAAAPAAVLADAAMAELAAAATAGAALAPAIALPDPQQLPDAENAARKNPAELALLQFTSGSSGTPKGVRVTAGNLAANVAAIHGWLGVTPEDSCSSWLPLYHDMGLIGTLLGSVVAQIDLWLMSPLDFIRSPRRWLDCHGRDGVTITTAPNFGYSYANAHVRDEALEGSDFSRWRVAMSGAERIDPAALAGFAERLAPWGFRPTVFAPCYGMAETTLAVTGVTPGAGAGIVRVDGALRSGEPVTVTDKGTLGVDRPADGGTWLSTCGAPVPETQVDIVDEQGIVLPEGCFGEIRVRGASVALGYQQLRYQQSGDQSAQPASSASFTEEGLNTGDAGFLLGGELYVVGRIGDSLKVRGRKVHAEDLETTLAGAGLKPGRCVVALGSTPEGNHAVVVVEAKDSEWLDGVTGSLRAALDASVRVSVVRAPRGSIPRTSSGKPRRRLVWQQAQDGALPGELVYSTGAGVNAGTNTPASGPTLGGAI